MDWLKHKTNRDLAQKGFDSITDVNDRRRYSEIIDITSIKLLQNIVGSGMSKKQDLTDDFIVFIEKGVKKDFPAMFGIGEEHAEIIWNCIEANIRMNIDISNEDLPHEGVSSVLDTLGMKHHILEVK